MNRGDQPPSRAGKRYDAEWEGDGWYEKFAAAGAERGDRVIEFIRRVFRHRRDRRETLIRRRKS